MDIAKLVENLGKQSLHPPMFMNLLRATEWNFPEIDKDAHKVFAAYTSFTTSVPIRLSDTEHVNLKVDDFSRFQDDWVDLIVSKVAEGPVQPIYICVEQNDEFKENIVNEFKQCLSGNGLYRDYLYTPEEIEEIEVRTKAVSITVSMGVWKEAGYSLVGRAGFNGCLCRKIDQSATVFEPVVLINQITFR